MLRFLVLTGDDYPGWNMRNANSRVGGIHTLSSRPGGSVHIYTKFLGIDVDLDFFSFRQNRYCHSRCMNSSASLSNRHSLDSMDATFKFEAAVNPFPFNQGNNFLKTPNTYRILTHDIDVPSLLLGVFRIHAK